MVDDTEVSRSAAEAMSTWHQSTRRGRGLADHRYAGFPELDVLPGNGSLHDHGRGIVPNVSCSGPSDTKSPGTEESSVPHLVSAPVENISAKVSLRMEKVDVSGGTSLKPAGSPVDQRKKMRTKKRKMKEPDWTEDMNVRNCTREKDPRRRRRWANIPVRSIQEMNQMLVRNQRSSCTKAPEWSSPIDQQILEARREILNAPIVEDDEELYPPIYRNFSTFKRSYELMEKMLKVYVYKEGDRPIFHEPLLSGIYAAEGWFMKHMEENNRFLVDDPAKAHLFYMPYGSATLRFKLFDPVIRNKGIMIDRLQTYVSTIASKYSFWNRTGGADHFSVACHDWLGKDVSITLTPVRNAKNPLQNVGGKPAGTGTPLAFFAGQPSHGYVRPLLLQHWGTETPTSRTYAEHMKSSKYCLCPRGFEVNSPRLAEAFFYECVPVIISDNLVPPFFDVLNWEAFSVVVPVKDIPRLKEILQSIPRKKYLALQAGVKKVQRHFLWHNKPEKYDLFHTTLHSIWFNRVLQFRDQQTDEIS
ncbi:unnamed protein product [Spirodela intermedia]|uniref:Exostosin GT47 domain-containing protein n=1 Tax=Spirodela intermedia TaxID=51605 RepID=A0A7I8JPY2_SPIIN|nr:unnamed protein product [Spirodela intermedia]CAA6671623.1 unnamed protein product [Spirodela intermedia]